MNIVLLEPEIPQNTGNIARTCAATGAQLHIIRPLGFEISDRYLKRAGLDYWHLVKLHVHESWGAFLDMHASACTDEPGEMYFFSTKAGKRYDEVEYGINDWLVFGPETRGLPEEMLSAVYSNCVRIPMINTARSLNLSNSVAIALYEALRKQSFPGMQQKGMLTGGEDPAHSNKII